MSITQFMESLLKVYPTNSVIGTTVKNGTAVTGSTYNGTIAGEHIYVPDSNLTAGLVNIRGPLQVCVDLGRLLGVEPAAAPAPAAAAPPAGTLARLLVVERAGDRGAERWVFGVDEVAGVQRVPAAALRAVPSTVGAATDRATAALFAWQERTVGLLDERRLLDGLRAQVSG